MQNIVNAYLKKFKQERQNRRRAACLLLAAAMLVTLTVNWNLRLTGISMTNEASCGIEEHTHTDACYTKTLVCEYADSVHHHSDACYTAVQGELICGKDETAVESEGHTHTDACYAAGEPALTCGKDESAVESEGHTHTDACYTATQTLTCGQDDTQTDENGNPVHTHSDACYTATQTLACGQEESAAVYHTHTDACYTAAQTLICGLEESAAVYHTHTADCYAASTESELTCGYEEGEALPDADTHTHTDECYETTLTCTQEEHTHTADCYSDPDADTETAANWEAALPADLTEDWQQNVLAVAASQVNYTESALNWQLDDTKTRQGYTRYGAWYGNAYGEWNGMFAAFVLHYANIPEDVITTQNAAGVNAWLVTLAEAGELCDASYTLQAGDIVFMNEDEGDPTAAVVAAVTDTTLTLIQGDVDGTVKQYDLAIADADVRGSISVANASAAHLAEVEETADEGTEESLPPVGEGADTDVSADEGTESGTLTASGSDYTVTVTYTADAQIPEGASLRAVELTPGTQEYESAYQKTLETLAAQNGYTSTQGLYLNDPRLFDISILDADGNEIEPAASVELSITYANSEESNGSNEKVVHIDNSGSVEVVPSTTEQTENGKTVSVSASGFSPFITVNEDSIFSFEELVDSVTVQHIVNGVWTDTTEVTDGEYVRCTIKYSADAGEIPSEATKDGITTMAYKMNADGAHVKIASEMSGVIYQGSGSDSFAVGTYTIDTNGIIVLKFDNSKLNTSNAFSGSVYFESYIKQITTDSSETFSFPGASNTITVKKNEETYDISVKKATVKTNSNGTYATDESGNYIIDYVITASTVNGTGDTVTITDAFKSEDWSGTDNAVAGYGDIKVYKVTADAAGTETEVDSANYTLTKTTDESVTPNLSSFSITGLPALAAGEKYVVKYAATVTPDSRGGAAVKNQAGAASSGITPDYDSTTTEIGGHVIEKSGHYDSTNNTILWTITVNKAGADISGYVLEDDLSNVGTLASDITITASDGTTFATIGKNTVTDKKINYTFTFDENATAAQKTDTYTVTFRTAVDGTETSGTVKNTASFGGKTDTAGVSYTKREDSVTKTANTTANMATNDLVNWTAAVTVGDASATEFVYKDTILDATNDSSETLANTHYATLADLNTARNNIKLTLADGSGTIGYAAAEAEGYTFTVTGYANAEDTTPVTATSAQIKYFELKITKGKSDALNIASVTFPYQTHVVQTGGNTGATWTYTNKGSYNNKEDSDTYKKIYRPSIEKQVLTATTSWGNTTYSWTSADEANVAYDATNGVLYYRIIIQTTMDNAAITLTDTIEGEGMSFDIVGTSARTDHCTEANVNYSSQKFYAQLAWYDGTTLNDYNKSYKCDNGTWSGDVNVHPTVSDYGKTLTIKIDEGYNYQADGSACNNSPHAIMIYYEVKLDETKKYQDQVCKNTVTWDENTDTIKTTVTKKEYETAIKEGKQRSTTVDGVTVYQDIVDYWVAINPNAADLVKDSDTITLTDTLNISDSKMTATLDMDSIKLYLYDPNAADNHYKGGELDASFLTSYSYDSSKNQMTITLKDKTACVLEYSYIINRNGSANTNDQTITNTIHLEGRTDVVNKTTEKYVSSGADVQQSTLKIYKIDAENELKYLAGAGFKLEVWTPAAEDSSTGTWTTVTNVAPNTENGTSVGEKSGSGESTVYTTGSGGKLEFTVSSASKNTTTLQTNTIYKITETAAPTGYSVDTTPHYFVIHSGDASTDKYANSTSDDATTIATEKTNVEWGADTTYYHDLVVNKGTVAFTVANEATGVSVRKVWQNSDGSVMDSTANMPEEVTVQLYQSSTQLAGREVSFSGMQYSVTTDSGTTSSYTGSVPLSSATARLAADSQVTLSLTVEYDSTSGALQTTLQNKGFTKDSSVYTQTFDSIAAFETWKSRLNGTLFSLTTTASSANFGFSGVTLTGTTVSGYEIAGSGTKIGSEVKLNAENSWSYTWTPSDTLSLPETDASNNPYYYYVKEVGESNGTITLSGNTYEVSYTNNSGVAPGGKEIVINNKAPKVVTHDLSVTKAWTLLESGSVITSGSTVQVKLAVKTGDTAFATITLTGNPNETGATSATVTMATNTSGTPDATLTNAASAEFTYNSSTVTAALSGWTVTLTGIPGTSPTYTVTETSVTQGGTDITAKFNKTYSVSENAFTVTNAETEYYELPKTGGMGTMPLCLLGTALMLIALALPLWGRVARRRRAG